MPFTIVPPTVSGQMAVLQIKETPSSPSNVNKPIALNPTNLLQNVVNVLVTNANGQVIKTKSSTDITLEDLESNSGFKAFGLNTVGDITCGIIFIPTNVLDKRDGLIFPNGVIECHPKSAATTNIVY